MRPELTASLAARGIEAPFPIQAATLPDSLGGRDVLGRGRTGSGKTVAFALPLVSALAGSRSQARCPRGLVLVPTRELAVQVDETIAPLAAAVGLRTRTIFGGVSQGPQVTALAKGADIIVATPGRLADLIKQGHAAQPVQQPGGGRGKPRRRKSGTRQGALAGGSRTSSQRAGTPKHSGAAKPPRIARLATQQALELRPSRARLAGPADPRAAPTARGSAGGLGRPLGTTPSLVNS